MNKKFTFAKSFDENVPINFQEINDEPRKERMYDVFGNPIRHDEEPEDDDDFPNADSEI